MPQLAEQALKPGSPRSSVDVITTIWHLESLAQRRDKLLEKWRHGIQEYEFVCVERGVQCLEHPVVCRYVTCISLLWSGYNSELVPALKCKLCPRCFFLLPVQRLSKHSLGNVTFNVRMANHRLCAKRHIHDGLFHLLFQGTRNTNSWCSCHCCPGPSLLIEFIALGSKAFQRGWNREGSQVFAQLFKNITCWAVHLDGHKPADEQKFDMNFGLFGVHGPKFVNCEEPGWTFMNFGAIHGGSFQETPEWQVWFKCVSWTKVVLGGWKKEIKVQKKGLRLSGWASAWPTSSPRFRANLQYHCTGPNSRWCERLLPGAVENC